MGLWGEGWGRKMVMLRHLPRDGNGFGVVTARVEIWNGLNFFFFSFFFTHRPWRAMKQFPSPPTNLIAKKCFQRDG